MPTKTTADASGLLSFFTAAPPPPPASTVAKLSPEEFANLSLPEKRDYQIKEATDIFKRLEAGGSATESEKDFAFRILGKRIPEAPTPGAYENISEGLDKLSGSFGLGVFKATWPLIIFAGLAIAILYYWKKPTQ